MRNYLLMFSFFSAVLFACNGTEAPPVEEEEVVVEAAAAVEEGVGDDGWASLFDGATLEGWKSNEETPGCFTVEHGALKVSGGRAHIFYDGPVGDHNFRDFEFRCKVMTRRGANSGIYFATRFQAGGWPERGYEAQVNNTHADHIKTGSLYGIENIENLAPVPDDEWFDYYIKVEGQQIVIKINGRTLIDYTEPEDVERPRHFHGRLLGSGTIGFQGHDPHSTAFFKDIELRVLNEEEE